MSWQSARHTIFHAADGTHYFMRAEEWPFAAGKSGPVRFWIDAELPAEIDPPTTLIRYLLTGERISPTLMVEQKIEYSDPATVEARHDWTDSPRDFSIIASDDAARAVHRYVFNPAS